jgi:2-polyprenyl-6-methoxyphenol hydroxylase-like FAD-dependent oxidoreductase
MMRSNRMNIVIVGAGIAGLTAAYWLHRYGHRVRIIERTRTPDPGAHGFMIDFFGPGYSVAEAMHILPELGRVHREIPRWSFETTMGTRVFSLEYAKVRRRMFGDRHFNVLRSDLERVLLALVRDEVEIRTGTTITGLRKHGPTLIVALSDGTQIECDLVIGAGGMHSPTRHLMFGDGRSWVRYLGLDAAAFSIEDPELHESMRGTLRTMTGPGRQATVYPMSDGRLGAFFLHERGRTLDDRSKHGIANELARVYGSFGDVVQRFLVKAEIAPDLFYDEVAQVRLPQWSLGRVVLIGDACHCVSPLGGQGASLAMASAWSLVHELLTCAGEVEPALLSYERRMRPSVQRVQESGVRMARWVAPQSGMKRAARDLMLRACVWPVASSLTRRVLGSTMQLDLT